MGNGSESLAETVVVSVGSLAFQQVGGIVRNLVRIDRLPPGRADVC
jgi:hypothetical protein